MTVSLLPSLVRQFSPTLSSSHPHSNPFSFSLSLILHFHHSSLRELIASSFVLGEQRGTMAEWGLSLWQQAWDKREREGDKEERQREKEQAQRGCWLLAGRQGSERWLITLVSMHTAIKPWCTHTYTVRAQNIHRQPHTHTCSATSERKCKQERRWQRGRKGEAGKGKKKWQEKTEAILNQCYCSLKQHSKSSLNS